jgi:hypothetical protein
MGSDATTSRGEGEVNERQEEEAVRQETGAR